MIWLILPRVCLDKEKTVDSIDNYEKFCKKQRGLICHYHELLESKFDEIVKIYRQILDIAISFRDVPNFRTIDENHISIAIVARKIGQRGLICENLTIETKLMDMSALEIREYLTNKKSNGDDLIPVDFLNSIEKEPSVFKW